VAVYGSNGVVGFHDRALTAGPTVVVGRKGSVGAVHFSAAPCWPIDTTYYIDDFGPLDPEFTGYLLRGLGLAQLDVSTAVPGINRSEIYAKVVWLPPLSEQRRIVAAVEVLLASVRAARDRLARVPPILKRFRQVVRAAACSGRLTADWRDGRSVSEVGSQLVRRITPRDARAGEVPESLTDIPASWSWASLDQLRQTGRPIIYGIIKPGPHIPDGVPYVRVGEMKEGRIDVGRLRRTAHERAARFRRATLAAGDILISKDGTIGRVAVVPPELEGGNITQHIVRFAPSPELNREYLVLAIRSPDVQAWLTGEGKGVALQGVNVEDFRRTPLPIPPLVEQHAIVQRVNALFSLADTVEDRLQRAGARADQLSEAILARAFNGDLVPTEANLALAEGRSFEPARVLLERVGREGGRRDRASTARIPRANRARVAGGHGRREQ
jgi:type I restriction enzyme S subunit